MTPTHHWISAALALALGVTAFRAFQKLRGTTLAAPAAWAVASALAMSAVEVALGVGVWPEQSLAAYTARYFAAVGTFCPVMAVLGAKRPQDRGWQWIVFSLWIVLMVPAGQAWAARGSGEFRLGTPWLMLVYALASTTASIYLPTRWALHALAFTGMQYSALVYLLLNSVADEEPLTGPLLGLLLLFLFHKKLGVKWHLEKEAGPLAPFTQRWSNFRNGWGAFWALRVMHRINETAELSQWPVRLAWGGFAFTEEHRNVATLDASVAAQIQQTMDSLLWRFERRDQARAT